jgi:chromate reductase, NAD(P)H dehydrogenase (quinone)
MTDGRAQQIPRLDVRVLVLSASLRRNSLNSQLAGLTGQCIEANGGGVTVKSLAEFDMPSYDQDVQDEKGFQRAPRHSALR